MARTKTRNRIIFWAGIVLCIILLGVLSHCIGLKTAHAWAARINGWVLFLAMALLPLVGAPMSILGIMAGAKFGPLNGLAVSAAAIACNLILSWWVARKWLHGPVQKLLRKVDYKMPELETTEYAGVCIITAVIPGPSYTLKNYFLALSNLPFRIIFWIGLPAHLFAVSPGVLFGGFSGAMTWQKGLFIVLYTLLLVGASHYLVWRMRSRRKARSVKPTDEKSGRRSTADGRTPRGSNRCAEHKHAPQ
ncbi:MAG TPA: VTT domain-containing protein [Verrucomicrobiae bacterium]|jgi:uncharacterized membrane protein YdjX (TVP38/TMEM64 family)